MALSVGDRLGPYEILAPIGAGGMGEVYKARDTRLGREVAIKVSAPQFTERFEREARAIAALNHPNICTLFDVGPNYLVMEYIDGESPKGPMPLDEALRIASKIAAALEAAHEKNITHRDLKPGNIKIKHDGSVKVLDCGLISRSGGRRLGMCAWRWRKWGRAMPCLRRSGTCATPGSRGPSAWRYWRRLRLSWASVGGEPRDLRKNRWCGWTSIWARMF